MEKNNNSVRTWLIIGAVIIGVAAVIYTLIRMEKRLRRAYGRVERWLNVQDQPLTIDLADDE